MSGAGFCDLIELYPVRSESFDRKIVHDSFCIL